MIDKLFIPSAQGILCAFVLAIGCTPSPVEESQAGEEEMLGFYVGTYTDSGSKGIYFCRLDTGKASLELVDVAAEVDSPSFLSLHSTGGYLYAVNEVRDFQGQRTGSVTAFSVDRAAGELTLLNQASSGGAGPCFVTVHPSGRAAAVANYGAGTIALFPLEGDGRIHEPSSVIQHQGSGPNQERQKGPHAHSARFGPGGYLYAADLGLDKVLVYQVDLDGESLVPLPSRDLETQPGAGPRHIVFHPENGNLYVVNEMASTVEVFSAPGSEQPRRIQDIATLPEGWEGESWTAEITLSPDGRFCYVSNRGHDSLSIFRVNPDGLLELTGHMPTGGETPRHFAIDPSGRFLVAANQDSDNLVLFRVEPETGGLTETGSTISIPRPVCVLFLPGS